VHKYIHNVTKVTCALYVRCTLSVLQKECREVWGARYTLGAHYRSENTVLYTLHCGQAVQCTKAGNMQGIEGCKLSGVQQRRVKYLR